MKGKMAAMITGAILTMSAATLPAFAYVSHTKTQPLLGEQQQTQVLGTKSVREQQKWLLQKWSVEDKDVKVVGRLTSSDRAKYLQFKAGIEQGLNPLAAAKQVRASFMRLESTDRRQLYLSLSTKAYATLQLDIHGKVVKVLQVGTRQQPIQTSRYAQALL